MHTRKILLAAILFTASAAGVPAPVATETVKFGGQTLALASSNNSDTESLKEYIPAGEKLDSWSKLASIHVFKQVDDPIAAVDSLQAELKKQSTDAQSHLLKNAATGEAVIDFVAMAPDKAYAEFNVMKFAKNPGGGMVIYQYAMRAYGKNIDRFLKGLNGVRERLVSSMTKEGLVPGKPK